MASRLSVCSITGSLSCSGAPRWGRGPGQEGREVDGLEGPRSVLDGNGWVGLGEVEELLGGGELEGLGLAGGDGREGGEAVLIGQPRRGGVELPALDPRPTEAEQGLLPQVVPQLEGLPAQLEQHPCTRLSSLADVGQ